jgi:hypothetical protein
LARIILKLSGGLGNQLFQYAAAKAMSLRNNNTPICFDLSYYLVSGEQDTKREFLLDQLIYDFETSLSFDYSSYLKFSFLKKYFKNSSIFKKYFHEYQTRFCPEILRYKPPIYLTGHFQTIKYFQDLKQEIRDSITINYNYQIDAVNSILKSINLAENSVSVHFRRTDFIYDKFGKYLGGQIPDDYYYNAFTHIEKLIKNPTYFVFSDDINWVKRNIEFKYPTIFVDYNIKVDYSPVIDLFLMTKCKNNIISNSTFSWWGAFLNKNGSKIVLGPRWWISDHYWNADYEIVRLEHI